MEFKACSAFCSVFWMDRSVSPTFAGTSSPFFRISLTDPELALTFSMTGSIALSIFESILLVSLRPSLTSSRLDANFGEFTALSTPAIALRSLLKSSLRGISSADSNSFSRPDLTVGISVYLLSNPTIFAGYLDENRGLP